jgi:hypothetical protein
MNYFHLFPKKNLVNYYIELGTRVPLIKNKNPKPGPETLFKIWYGTTLLIMA